MLLTLLILVLGIGWHAGLLFIKSRKTRRLFRPPLEEILTAAELDVLRTLRRRLLKSAPQEREKLAHVEARVRELELREPL